MIDRGFFARKNKFTHFILKINHVTERDNDHEHVGICYKRVVYKIPLNMLLNTIYLSLRIRKIFATSCDCD